MVDSPLYPVERPRRSFLDEYVDDQRLQKYAEDQGIVAPTDREGSVFMEIADPNAPGGKRYIARKRSAFVGMPGSTYSEKLYNAKMAKVGDHEGAQAAEQARVMQDVDPLTGERTDFVTEDKTYAAPKVTNRQAMSFKDDFERDLRKREIENERIRRRAEEKQAQKDLMAAEVERTKQLGNVGLNQRIAEANAMRDLERKDPNYARREALATELSQAQIEALRRQSTVGNRQNAVADREFNRNEELLYKAKNFQPKTGMGKRVYQDTLASTADPLAAQRAAMEADTKSLEQIGTTGVRSFIDKVGDFAKRDDAVFGSDPTSQELEDIVSNAMNLRNHFVRQGDDERVANAKILEALKAGAGGISDDMIDRLRSRLNDLLGG